MRRWVLPAAGLLVVAGVVAALWLTGVLRMPGAAKASGPAASVPAVSVAIPLITTNLSGSGGTHFAQVGLTVAVAGPKVASVCHVRLPQVQDAIIGDIRAQTLTQLSGAQGMVRLGRLVRKSLDAVLGAKGDVRAVYFTTFIVQ